jgi:hypothetical protein
MSGECPLPEKSSREKIPSILQPWIHLYHATPKINIPGTRVDISFSLCCAVIFSALRLTFRHVLYRCGWPVGASDTYFTSACQVSFCTSSLMLPGLAALLLSQKYVPSGMLEPSPQWYQDATHALMGYCTGYMIYDSVMGYVVETWQPGIGPVLSVDDWTYLGHHILTTLYMVSARIAMAGHMSAIALMFCGEFSAPFMNLYLILEKACLQDCWKGIAWLPTLYAYSKQFFSFVYIVCRVAIGPILIAHISYDLLLTTRGRKHVPVWLSISWMPMCWVSDDGWCSRPSHSCLKNTHFNVYRFIFNMYTLKGR